MSNGEEQKFGPVTLAFYDGSGQEMNAEFDVLVGIKNGIDIDQSRWLKGPVISLNLEFHNGPGDRYTITVWTKGYRGTGDFVRADPAKHHIIKMLLIPSDEKLAFCSWTTLISKHPAASKFLGISPDGVSGEERYIELQRTKPAALASFLNLISALSDIDLGGKTPLDFLKMVTYDDTFAQDRFFGYADPAIIPIIKAAANEGQFDEEKNCAQFHAGSTCSYKQTTYDYSNVQLTFHERDEKIIDGIKCVKIEPDMDLYKNLLDHGLMEVIPNLSTRGLTNPVDILALRWLDAADDAEEPFDPGYTVS